MKSCKNFFHTEKRGMIVSIGYACLHIGLTNTNIRTVIQRNATEEKLTEVTAHNLSALEKMIDYNILNDIRLYRISSGLVPFGSSPINRLPWDKIHQEAFERIGKKVAESGMRVSFHPGQYTVLNSPSEEVVNRAIDDLIYQEKILTCLGTNSSHKLILHVGGVYGDKEGAMERFVQNFQRLPESVKARLIIENDDRLYHIEDVLALSKRIGIPVVYDNLHNAINPPPTNKDDNYWITEANKTWKKEDGKQKIHYSQQAPDKRLGAHTDTIYLKTFLEFYKKIPDTTIDIMLEVKDKNLSAIKCQNAITDKKNIMLLEKEWARYKYLILEKSPAIYQMIRTLLKDKADYPVIEFYELIEKAQKKETNPGEAENTAQHVWGYFKDKATVQEKRTFIRNCEKYRNQEGSLQTIKRQLFKLAVKYEEAYLLESLYFYL